MNLKMAYMTLNGQIPSRKADGVAVMNTCAQFANQGIDVELIIPRMKLDYPKPIETVKSTWDFYSLPESFTIKNFYFPWPFVSKSWKKPYPFMAVTYSVIRRKSLIYSRQIGLAYMAALYGRPSIFESHNYYKHNERPNFANWIKMLRDPSRKVAMVVTTHSDAKAYHEAGVPKERMLVEPNGVNVEGFLQTESKGALRRSLGLPENMPVACYCGRLRKRKGIDELLACAKILNDVLFLLVGGEPDEIDRCKSLIREMGLKNIKLAGYVPPEAVPKHLVSSDILVMPQSTHPRSTMKIFDYLASGRPIVSTDYDTVREILHDRKNAVLVPPGNAEALASGIQWLIDSPENAKKISEQSIKDVRHYSWENRGRRIVSWMRDIFNL